MDIQKHIDQLGSDIKELTHAIRGKEKKRLILMVERDKNEIDILLTDKPRMYLVGK